MKALLSPLDLKLVRDLWRIRGQAAAIMFVIAAGIALFVMSDGMLASLDQTMRAYYERQHFADVFAPVKRAPNYLLEDIRNLPGVSQAEGRVAGGAIIDLPDVDMPITAQVLSAPENPPASLNLLYLVSGRDVDAARADEIILLAPFARAHGLSPGDDILVTMNSTQRRLTIVGLALSPEFVYALNPGDFAPDDARVAVFWMGREAVGEAFDLDGAFNQVIVGLAKGASAPFVLDNLDRLLAPYGATGAYGRAEQLSNKYLTEELNQLRTMAFVLPPIFLAVAIFLLNIVITRMIQTEREQIGLLKAFGYANREVGLHYAKFVLAISFGGAGLGAAGGVWLGRMIAGIYQRFFKFPFLLFDAHTSTFAFAFGITGAAALLGVFFAVRQAVVLTPAVAMRPPAPADYSKRARLLHAIESRIDQPSRMVLRGLVRRPVRAAVTCLGIGAAMALGVMMRFNHDAINYMVDVNFNVMDRSDIAVTFVEPQSEKVIYELQRMDGVIAVEPARYTPVMMRHGLAEHLGSITGMIAEPHLNRAVDADLQSINVRSDGVILSRPLMEKLNLAPGDFLMLEVREGRRPMLSLPVVGVANSLLGTPAYFEIGALNAALGEGPRVSSAYLQTDALMRRDIYRELKDMPAIAGVAMQKESQAAFQKMVDEGPGVFRYIFTMFSMLIAAGVVYNSARIAYAERMRDLASLRVLGFTRVETAFILLGELGVIALLALPIGGALGYGLATYLARAFSTELYQIPVVANWSSYGEATLIVLVSAAVSGLLVQRDVNRLDLVAALKTRE